jgi:hypothetical protein
MKKAFLLLLVLFSKTGFAQNIPFSNEDFVNVVFRELVDSNFSTYYLSANAYPCSFKKFDYDEWYKYALKEDVPIYILNELAKNSFLDNSPRSWKQDKLIKAFCIDEEKIEALLVPGMQHEDRDTKNRKPRETNLVFYFSRPVFTGDYQYAVIDLSFRCDNHLCGMGATFLFKQVNGKWSVVGRKIAWGS